MTKRWSQLEAALARMTQVLDQLERRTEKMETILMVREPSSGAAADAYEGLRKQVVNVAAERLAHLAQLVQLDAALSAGADSGSVAKVVREWVEQASVAQVTNPGHANADLLYVMVEDRGGPLELLEPAYVDTITGRVIRQGRVRRSEAAQPAEDPGHPAPPAEESR